MLQQLLTRIPEKVKTPKSLITISLLIALGLYLLGITWILLALSVLALSLFLPRPRIFDSWLSGFVLSLLFVYSFLQIAAAIQFLIYPNGRFKLIAILFWLLIVSTVHVFGIMQPKAKLITIKDISALLGSVVFIAVFIPTLLSSNPLQHITRFGGKQVGDAVAHVQLTSFSLESQNFAYRRGDSYPLGFHMATAFIQKSTHKNFETASWKTHAYSYILQYLLWGLLLSYVLVYLGYLIGSKLFNVALSNTAIFSIGASVGLTSTLLYLLLFMAEGFLNYYYICAVLIASIYFVLDATWANAKRQLKSQSLKDKWGMVAFLLLGLGAAYTWPLFVPVLAATFILWTMPLSYKGLQGFLASLFSKANLWIIGCVGLYLLACFFQLYYIKGDASTIALDGPIQSFYLPLLVIGVASVTYLIGWAKKPDDTFKRSIVAVVLPYLLIVLTLMGVQYFILGEARYYLIKVSMPLIMITFVVTIAIITYLVERSIFENFLKIVIAVSISMLLAVVAIGMTPEPLKEVRELFSNRSHIGEPPFFSSDVALTAQLANSNQLTEYNLTILHYNPTDQKLFSHIQTAQWANAMGEIGIKDLCFGNQYAALAYGFGGSSQQQFLIEEVGKCIAEANRKNLNYYIVTDEASAPKVQQLFGNEATVVY